MIRLSLKYNIVTHFPTVLGKAVVCQQNHSSRKGAALPGHRSCRTICGETQSDQPPPAAGHEACFKSSLLDKHS